MLRNNAEPLISRRFIILVFFWPPLSRNGNSLLEGTAFQIVSVLTRKRMKPLKFFCHLD